MTITAYWELQKQCLSYRERYAEYWNRSGGVDAVIMPVAPSASVRKGDGRYFGYTGVGNVVDGAVVVVPAGIVDKEKDGRVKRDMEGVSEMDKEIWESCECCCFPPLIDLEEVLGFVFRQCGMGMVS